MEDALASGGFINRRIQLQGGGGHLEGDGHGLGQTVLQLLLCHREHVNVEDRQGVERVGEVVQEDVQHLARGYDAFVEAPDVAFGAVLRRHVDLLYRGRGASRGEGSSGRSLRGGQ